MKYEDVSPLCREAMAAYEAYRRLGFSADQISPVSGITVLPSGERSTVPYLSMQLRAQGKTFTMPIGPLDEELPQVQLRMNALYDAYRDGSLNDEDAHRMWRESHVASIFENLAAAMIMKGFLLPALAN